MYKLQSIYVNMLYPEGIFGGVAELFFPPAGTVIQWHPFSSK